MELFKPDGHISEEGFAVLLAGDADALGNLELSEHLAFCDLCCEKYAALLTDERLIEPPQPLAPVVLHRIENRSRTILFRRIVKVGAAACLAMGLWLAGTGSGVIPIESIGFLPTAPRPEQRQELLNRRQKEEEAARKSLKSIAEQEKNAVEESTLDMKISSALEELMRSLHYQKPEGRN